MAKGKPTRRHYGDGESLFHLAKWLGYEQGRTTQSQRIQMLHKKTGSMVLLPKATGGRESKRIERLLHKGASEKL